MAQFDHPTTFKSGLALDLRTADKALSDRWTETALGLARAGLVAGTCGTGFAFGTMIDTPSGAVPVERLMIGNLVLTQDNGPQPILSIGLSEHADHELVCIAPTKTGPDSVLTVRADHHVVVRSAIAELLFGDNEVLVRARDLVDLDSGFSAAIPGRRACVSLGLRNHEILTANGMPCSSGAFNDSARAARPALTAQEALVLKAPLDRMGYAGTKIALKTA
jgi:hypothetical protein